MKILKSGSTIQTVTCENCGCIYKYCQNDIKDTFEFISPNSDYPFDKFYFKYVRCPECDSQYIIK